MGKRVRAATVTRDRQSSTGRLRAVPLGEGLPDLERMRSEIDDMTAVLMGREDPPVEAGIMSLLEVADAYYARAAELTMLLQRAEQEGHILRGTALVKFRTGELRTFLEMSKRAADLGSRRLTHESMLVESVLIGRESRMY